MCIRDSIKSDDTWYRVKEGVPTGGIPSVDLGNIAVFYVLKRLVFSEDKRPDELRHFVRFVDDGSGIWCNSKESFNEWFSILRTASVALFGLDFTCEVSPINEYSQFLDIKFKFDNGVLTTDLFRKPTDANRYLEFSSRRPCLPIWYTLVHSGYTSSWYTPKLFYACVGVFWGIWVSVSASVSASACKCGVYPWSVPKRRILEEKVVACFKMLAF